MLASNLRRISLLVPFVLVLATLAGPATQSGAAPEKKAPKAKKNDSPAEKFVSDQGVFRVWLSAYQTARWTYFSDPKDGCSGKVDGYGKETMYLRVPPRRMRLSAFGTNRLDSMIFPQMEGKGWVRRNGVREYTPEPAPDPDCPYGDGGGGPYVPPLPDCGRKQFNGLNISVLALDGFFTLRPLNPDASWLRFKNCPEFALVNWPYLLTENSRGKDVRTRFPGHLVFNPKFNRKKKKWRRVTVIAKGTRKHRTMNGSSEIRLEWTLNFKRIR